MALHVYNQLTRQKEIFTPLVEGEVRMYVCGPTVYDYSHLGHAKTYVSFDVIARYLRYSGYSVRYVQNITDVGHLLADGEDRILKKAGALSVEPMQVVETYTYAYFKDMDDLFVVRPDISPRASGHVPEQISMTQTLIEKGHAYATDGGDVYFDVSSFPAYGKLSGQKVDELEAGTRVAVVNDKRHPADFALWRHAEPKHLMQWDSPWGVGFPGWHIECTAMATKYLGETFDIHGGGLENRFPHNECELAQSEALTGKTFSNYWLLTGSLTIDGVKMSKSLGNFVTIQKALETYSPEALRMFILSGHYNNPVDYSESALVSSQKRWEGLMATVRLAHHLLENAPESDDNADFLSVVDDYKGQFIAAMDDDFNAPKALAVLDSFSTEANTLMNSKQSIGKAVIEAILALYHELGGKVLGIVPDILGEGGADAARQDGLINLLIDLRKQARDEKNYDLSDQIRQQLGELGVQLEDRADATIYRLE